MVANAGGWHRIPERALILMSFMLIMCFYSSSQACWGGGEGAQRAIPTSTYSSVDFSFTEALQ